MKLYYADCIDIDEDKYYEFYIVARNEKSAIKKFIKELNRFFYRYEYYEPSEIEDEETENRWHDEKSGVYWLN